MPSMPRSQNWKSAGLVDSNANRCAWARVPTSMAGKSLNVGVLKAPMRVLR